MSNYIHSPQEPIAIIGSGCRFPGSASSPSRLWDLLVAPRDVSKRVPESRFNPDGFYHPNGEHHGASNVTKSYFLDEDPRLFDSVFFNITPREAEAIDPQQRLLLETVFEAMDSSGLTMKELQGSLTSAYVGMMTSDYTDTHARDPESFSQYQATGTSRALVSNRLSYFFDWKGPSMTVDTACSSSLTAIHLALQSLRSGESKVSCAAGVNLLLTPDLFIGATSLHMISPSGKSQMWDAGADGYARGEGIAAVFLKTLSQALRDGDRIDALVRETGVNSDGRTKGITLPNPEAQATLIRETYRRAGLNLLDPQQRPQYFEAHGTGTQAGDPREASAIKSAFFPSEEPTGKLLVGSIKTVVGHTEGCAGIAGVLKATLAMQNKTIPPNQHLKNLNPSVEVSYGNLRIPTEALPWPQVAQDSPLRASINSFGFGGSNAHAIIESYVPEIHNNGPWGQKAEIQSLTSSFTDSNATMDYTVIPLVLSANSDRALIAMASNYAEILQSQKINLSHLAWTLQARRTLLPQRICFSGSSRKEILADMQNKIGRVQETPGMKFGLRASNNLPEHSQGLRVLGVFTGQGAQWPQMGRHLILNSSQFRNTIEALEGSLAMLPDPPSWSLKEELFAGPDTSRLNEAKISQPLCTAIQVALVKLLNASGIVFHSVVGHSSGEIAAAFAAGHLSETDAIRIAYYRGVHARLAGSNGKKGAMMAVGFGIEEAHAFCSSAKLKDRLRVAASNSPGGVTLSGDADAVQEAKTQLDEQGLFNRVLQVDTAYHSHHMAPCADPYIESLLACNIQIFPERGDCTWISSVYGSSKIPSDEELKATYWKDNMVEAVLFSQAVDEALDLLTPFDFALEVGPHAALRGPALQTIKGKLGREVPYVGVLDRKKNDVTAFSYALGSMWTQLGPDVVSFSGYASAFSEDNNHINPAPLPDLPAYPWEHENILWRESRLNKQFRLRTEPPHELLGVRTPDDTPQEPRWRNLLKLDELAWLSDHRIQGQIIVPGAAYCIMAFEAAKSLGGSKPLRMIEIQDLSIERPISLDESSEATETLFSLRETSIQQGMKSDRYQELIEADFTLSAGAVEDGVMRKVCHGKLLIYIGDDPATISINKQHYVPHQQLRPMSIERFYSSLEDVGLRYTGPFRGLVHAERKLDMASGVVARHELAAGLPVHPTFLDVAFQSLFAAFAAPGDETMWTAFVPSFIRRIRFDPKAGAIQDDSSTYNIDTYLTDSKGPSASHLSTITGDINIFNGSTGSMDIQIEDLTMTALLSSNPQDDRHMYAQTVWQEDINTKFIVPRTTSESTKELVEACKLVVYDYLLKLERSPGLDNDKGSSFSSLLKDANFRNYRHSNVLSPDVSIVKEKFKDSSDMQLVVTVGDTLLKNSQRQNTKHGLLSIESLLSQSFKHATRDAQQIAQLFSIVSQIAHRYPRMRILQVGIDFNVDMAALIAKLGESFSSYTVVDESPSRLKDIEEPTMDSRVRFVPLQSENGLEGFETGSFDLVLCGYQNMDDSPHLLRNARGILRPGGYLLLGDLVHDFPQHIFVMHGLALLQQSDSGTGYPFLRNLRSPVQWNNLLKETGFSGVDAIIHNREKYMNPSRALFVSQATDPIIDALRNPLEVSDTTCFSGASERVLIIGGLTLRTTKLISKLRSLLRIWDIDAIVTDSLSTFDAEELLSIDSLISITDLDYPVLAGLDEKKLANLQKICDNFKSILWVTNGASGDDPYQSAMVGLGRTIISENPHVSLQLIDVDSVQGNEKFLVESFLRLKLSKLTEMQNDSHLWSREHELAIIDGKLMIPRIVPDVERNNRYNSKTRKINSIVDVMHSPVRIVNPIPSKSPALERLFVTPSPAEFVSNKIELNVEYCSANPYGSSRSFYLCIGSNASDATSRYVAITPENASTSCISALDTVKCNVSIETAVHMLSAVMCKIRALAIIAFLPEDKTSVLLGVDRMTMLAVQDSARGTDKNIVFLTTDQSLAVHGADVIVVYPEASARYVRSRLPRNTELLIDCSSAERPLDRSLAESLSTRYRTISSEEYEKLLLSDSRAQISDKLSSAVHFATNIASNEKSFSQYHSASSIISAEELVLSDHPLGPNAIVNWTAKRHVTVAAQPISPSLLFSSNKTYVLFGLTGQIGRSISQWIVSNGAKHIVVASRSPVKDSVWETELLEIGAHLRIEAVDITKRSDIERLCSEVLSTMPPIGGIANGAMVLADGLFANMNFDSMQKVLRPKMEGSRNLNEVFYAQDLDFFIMFSSLSAVIGMPSQSNYAAANMYMVGLAAQRRKRGVVASVIDLGMMVGIGYISRAEGDEGNGAVETSLKKQNYMPVAERDLHEILTEAIAIGKQGGPREGEIIIGLDRYKPSAKSQPQPVWLQNPRFSHLIMRASNNSNGTTNTGEDNLRAKVLAANGAEHAIEILQTQFTTYLAYALKLSANQISNNVPILDFGIDSLVAVEIRTWFSTETGQDVPVLKILGGATIQQLCSGVAETMYDNTKQPNTEVQEVKPTALISQNSIPPSTNDFSNLSTQQSLTSTAPSSAESTVSAGEDVTPSTSSVASDIRIDAKGTGAQTKLITRTGPLSLGQARFYFPSLYLEDHSPFNCTTSYQINGPLDPQKLSNALKMVVQRHEILRTIFTTDKTTGKGVQSVLENGVFQMKSKSTQNDNVSIESEFQKMHAHVFNLEEGDTLRATVLAHSPKKHTIIFGYHHIVMDGVSWQSFLQDLADCYNRNLVDPLPTGMQYLDFTWKQMAGIASNIFQERLDYWKSEFPTAPEPMPLLPFAKVSTRKAITEYKTRTVVTHVDRELVARIRKTTQALRSTAFHFWLATFQAMMARFLDISQLCIGIVDANRTDQTFAKTIGFLLEILPVNFTLDESQKFSTMLQNTRTKVYGALGRSGVPFEEIVKACNLPTSATETPFFQVVFNYRMGATKTPDVNGVEMSLLDYADATTPFDISVSLDEKDDGTGMITFAMLDYLYDDEGASMLVNTYKHMLDVLSRDPSMLVRKVPLFTQAIVNESISAGTGPALTEKWPQSETVSKRIAAWVEKDPHAIAVKDMSGASKTYLQVLRRADAISTALQRAGAIPGSLVCVLAEPTVDTVCYILAILRIGAVYVPLDIRNADERLSVVLRESGAQYLLFQTATKDRAMKLRRTEVKCLNISILEQEGTTPILDVSKPDDLAFVLYTSGSTGEPKGIALSNINMAVQNASVVQRLNIGREVVLQQSGLGFDASLCQIFMCLCNGGKLIIGDNRGDPAELASLVEQEKVTFTICMMSEMSAMLRNGKDALKRCSSWRLAMCAGEAFTPRLAEEFSALNLTNLEVVNAYGPTEGTIMATIEKIAYRDITTANGARIGIGEVIPSYGVYVVGDDGKPVPRGFAGQLALAGPGVAQGYLGANNASLTKSKFKPDTISPQSGKNVGWVRLYLTGDKGRLLENGRFLHLGRMDGDSQVKLRGIRIELQEITQIMLSISLGCLAEVAVIVRGNTPSNQLLVAFVVFAVDCEIKDKQEYLRKLIQSLPLPAYMRPAIAVPIESLPVTGRGKLDTKVLAGISIDENSTTEQQADIELTATERRLKGVWQAVLAEVGVKLAINKTSDFFSVGGNSLLLMQLRVQIKKTFDADIPLLKLFQSTSLEALAARITGMADDTEQAIDWEKETHVSNEIISRSWDDQDLAASQGPINVLLTGSTGFLGSGILRKLVSNPRVAKVHCVAIRGGRSLSLSSPKIVPHAGDLALSFLGMSESEATATLADVQLIINNGASVSHMKSYGSLKGPNLDSTKELVRLASILGKRIPIHYVSTGGIARLSGRARQPETSLASFPPPVDGTDGYVATKWANERFLERLNQATGWPIFVHRPSSITSRDESQVPESDITHNTLRYSRLLKAIPDFSQATGGFDFIDIETISNNIVAEGLASASLKTEQDKWSAVVYKHQSGETVVPVEKLKEFLGHSELDQFDVLSMDAWTKAAVEVGMDPLVASFLAATGGKIDMPLLTKQE